MTIGVIEAKQRETGEHWIRNDRLLAAATHAYTHGHVETLNDLRPRLLDEIEFFETYNALKHKEFKPIGRTGPKESRNCWTKVFAFSKRSENAVPTKAA